MPCSPRQEGDARKQTIMPRTGARKTPSVETVIIEVDDDETPSPAVSKKSQGRSLRSENKLQDTDKLCEFPLGKSPSVTVTFQDYKTLEHDTFLNDIIIDFYLTYLHENMLNKEDAPNVFIFSTMFYKRMLTQPSTKKLKPDSFERNPNLTAAQKRHMRVKGWTKNVELFSKDMIIIPICEHSHWYLVIVIKPGLIVNAPDSEARRLKGEPFFIILDSLGESKTTAVNNVRSYLEHEWEAKMLEDVDFSKNSMRTLRPIKPEQHNYSDCGIYLLHYVEKIFSSVAQFYWPETVNTLNDKWFPLSEVASKRSVLAQLIRTLNEDQRSPGEPEVNWPPINFLDPAPLPRSRKKAPGFFDEYLPDSSEEEGDDRDKGARKSIAEGFYGRSSRSTRSSTAPVPGPSGSRNPRRLNASGAAADYINALEEEGLPGREKAKKARHKARDRAKVIESTVDAKDDYWRFESKLEMGSIELKSKVEKTKEMDEEYKAGRAKVKERKLKQADTDIAFDKMRLYPKKAVETGGAKEEPLAAAEFDPSAERLFQTTVQVRERKGVREGSWSQKLMSKEKESRKEKMESGAMDDLKQIEEAHSEARGQEKGKKSHKNKALEVFNAAEVKKKGEMSLQLPSKEKQSLAGRSFQDQGGSHTAAASTRIQAILEESDVLKDLEELAEDGSDVVEGGPQVNVTKEGELQLDKTSQKEGCSRTVSRLLEVNRVHNGKHVSEGETVEAASASCKQPGPRMEQIDSPRQQKQKAQQTVAVNETKVLEESRPISVPSSPEVVEALREEQGEVLTLDDSPKPNHPLRSSAEKSASPTEVVEIIEEDVEEEGAITGFLERVPKAKTNTSLSSIDSPIYPNAPPWLFKKKPPAKKFFIPDTSSEDEEEDMGIISCSADSKDSVRLRGGRLAGHSHKKIKLDKK